MAKHIIFITGCPRSGTTLVQQILSKNSLTWSVPETHLFSLVKQRIGINCNTIFTKRQKKQIIQIYNKELGFPKKIITKSIGKSRTLIHFFEKLCLQYKKKNTKVLIEKTPLHILFANKIREKYPQAKFLFIYRNPWHVYSSWLKVPWCPKNKLEILKYWNQCLEAAFDFNKKYPHQIFLTRYEKICNNSHAEIRKICSFARLKFTADMITDLNCNKKNIILPFEKSWKTFPSMIKITKRITALTIVEKITILFLCAKNIIRAKLLIK